MARVASLVVVLLVFSAAIAVGAVEKMVSSKEWQTRTRKAPSVLSLFNMNLRSKFLNEKVLSHVNDDWEVSNVVKKEALVNYTKAGYLGYYLKLEEIDAVHIPVPINLIFLGFNGDGNQGIKLGQAELERWFTNLDHLFEHTRVPQLGESLTPFYRLKGDGTQRHHLPLVSNTHYNYSVHSIEMDAGVTEVFERAIVALSRREDPSDTKLDTEVMWQVDMDGMAHIFSSFINFLQLEDAYNIIVLNPKRNATRANYGYRRGLSEEELRFFENDGEAKKRVFESKGLRVSNPLEKDRYQKPLYARHPMVKFAWTTADYKDTGHWVDAYNGALSEVEKDLYGKSAVDTLIHTAQQILAGRSGEGNGLFRALKEGKPTNLQADCMVNTWVGKERWAFIDLSAGPFTWGPTVGGEGVRVERSLPSVDDSFGPHAGISNGASEDEVQEELQNMVQDRFTVFEDNQDPQQHAVDMLLAEIDVYEMFYFKHCQGRKVQLALCEELRERMSDVKSDLSSYSEELPQESQRIKASDALKRIEDWNLFDVPVVKPEAFSLSRDSFLAHLASTLSGSMKHLVTPSTADGAFHYYEKIVFQIYIITQERMKSAVSVPVDVEAIASSLKELIVPPQKVAFSVKKVVLSDDPALAMAFTVARRSAAVPVLLVNGTYRASNRVYLDSLLLQEQLQRLSGSGSISDLNAQERTSLEVPIFWFVRSGEEPLFIDKHYVAKALPDMVFVVQSSQKKWESHLQCNSKVIHWDLSRPIKAAVAAVAEHLAGLVETQLTYSHAHQNTAQDWTWVAGSHVLSCTSKGYELSSFQTDAIARSYMVTALDESIETINAGISLLSKEGTYEKTFGVVKARQAKLLRHYQSVVHLWKRIASLAETLRYGEVVKLLGYLERDAKDFYMEANETVAAMHPIRCLKERKVDMNFDSTQVLAGGIVVLAMLWLLLRRRRPKPKIN
ncbi:hypothetical protein KC19_6G020200 [Ceratodon purpureus]|uniref:DUF7906 domain-containing protein n=1 Tax=Ceratodon purpureus TaxID=3225 RepID=A0A8T0HAK2_CERPU|nr:hypothetical protein KC19_6G020200 [Ceratodon purpureus]